MQSVRNKLFIVSLITLGLSAVWFLLGTTANFQRGIDLVTTIRFAVIWLPSILLFIISYFLFKSRRSSSFSFLLWPLIVLHFILAIQLFNSVQIVGWLTPSVSSEYTQRTPDGLYNYRLELINQYQKNSQARLYLHNTVTGQITHIPLQINVDEIKRVWTGEGEQWSWSSLSSDLDNNQMELQVWRRKPLTPAVFNISISDGEPAK